MLLRESLGISADGSEKVFRTTDIEAFEAAVPAPLVWQDRDHRENVKFTFTAVDPSGGGASAFSISTVIVYQGRIQVCVYVSNAPLPCPHISTFFSSLVLHPVIMCKTGLLPQLLPSSNFYKSKSRFPATILSN